MGGQIIIIIMAKVKAVLIDFDEGDSGSEGEPAIGPKMHSQGGSVRLKYGHFRADTCQLEKNMLHADRETFNEYQLPEKNSIRYLSETEQAIDALPVKSKKQLRLKKMNEPETNEVKRQQAQQNKTGTKSKNLAKILKMDLSDSDTSQEGQKQQNVFASKVQPTQYVASQDKSESSKEQAPEEDGSESSQQQESHKPKPKLDLIDFDDFSNKPEGKRQLVYSALKSNQLLSCVLQRNSSGLNYFLPEIKFLVQRKTLDKNQRPSKEIVTCKKQLGTGFEFKISLSHPDFGEYSEEESYLGKVVGNFSNSVFNTYNRRGEVVATTRYKYQQTVQFLNMKVYEAFILKRGSSYSQLVGANLAAGKGLDELFVFPANSVHIQELRNRRPYYDAVSSSFYLDFRGLNVSCSCKNFILENLDMETILMFGKAGEDSFRLAFHSPMSFLQAIGVILPKFASKILVA